MNTPVIIDFDEEAIVLAESISPSLGIYNRVVDVEHLCRLSIQDNVLREFSRVADIYVVDPFKCLSEWLAPDVLDGVVQYSRDLVESKLLATLDVNEYRDVVWVSESAVVVS